MLPLGEVAKSFTRGFNISSLVPTAVLLSGVSVLLLSDAFAGSPAMDVLVNRLRGTPVLLTVLFFLAAVAGGLLTIPFQLPLVQLLEGYWGRTPVLRRLMPAAVEINRRRKQRLLLHSGNEYEVYELYPIADKNIQPTRLGNALRSAEDTAGTKHGLSTVKMFSRLLPLVSPPLAEAITDARDQIDSACRFCVTFWILAAVSLAALATDGPWLAAPVAMAVLGVLSYRGAVRAAVIYGTCIHAAFDLHHRDLIAAVGYEVPEDPQVQKALCQQITFWLTNANVQAPAKYRTKPTSPSAPSQS